MFLTVGGSSSSKCGDYTPHHREINIAVSPHIGRPYQRTKGSSRRILYWLTTTYGMDINVRCTVDGASRKIYCSQHYYYRIPILCEEVEIPIFFMELFLYFVRSVFVFTDSISFSFLIIYIHEYR